MPKILPKTYMAARSYIITNILSTGQGGSAILAGIESVPSLDGYLTTTIKGRAVPVLVGQDDDPILAYWDYGLGKVAAWTSDAKGSGRKDGLNGNRQLLAEYHSRFARQQRRGGKWSCTGNTIHSGIDREQDSGSGSVRLC